MSQLQFEQIFPYQQVPKLAKDHRYNLPKRAGFFCHPFKTAAKTGVYAYAPIPFRFKLTPTQLILQADTETAEVFELSVDRNQSSNNNFVLLSDVAANKSQQSLRRYRSRIPDDIVPQHIVKGEFGFYEVLINVFVEEDPFDSFIQIWLGGVITLNTDEGKKGELWVKQASNVNINAGYECLDAIIDTSVWQGWFAVVLKPTRMNEWVHVTLEQPLCQIIGVHDEITELLVHEFDEVSEHAFLEPLKWHMFDPQYNVKPGKYTRMLRAAKGK
ncbi:MAG: hypothetical protein ACJASL_004655 [Paraglaciecola sp.]